jgi:F-type H+-transporting ATPase subunit a
MGQFLPSALTLFAAEEVGEPSYWGFVCYLILVLGTAFALMAIAKAGINNRVFKKPLTQWFEQLYLFIYNMCTSIIGPGGSKYVTLIMTLWMMIFIGNVLALFLPFSPTADLSFNLGMAILCVAYVQYEGVRTNGLFGHVKHFAGPKLGLAMIPITILIFIIEIVSEMMKNISLSLRLFGNIHGGHLAVQSMNVLGDKILIPFGSFLLPIKLLTCVVQAMIFTLLTCVYLSLVTHHEGEEEHTGSQMEEHAPAMAH